MVKVGARVIAVARQSSVVPGDVDGPLASLRGALEERGIVIDDYDVFPCCDDRVFVGICPGLWVICDEAWFAWPIGGGRLRIHRTSDPAGAARLLTKRIERLPGSDGEVEELRRRFPGWTIFRLRVAGALIAVWRRAEPMMGGAIVAESADQMNYALNRAARQSRGAAKPTPEPRALNEDAGRAVRGAPPGVPPQSARVGSEGDEGCPEGSSAAGPGLPGSTS